MAPAELYDPSKNISSSFSLVYGIVDAERGVFLLNFTQLRNLERPPTSPEPWSWISFQFLMTSETAPHFDAFAVEISFALHLPGGGKVMYEKGTTVLDFLPPGGGGPSASSTMSQVAAPLWSRNPLSMNFSAVVRCHITSLAAVSPPRVDCSRPT